MARKTKEDKEKTHRALLGAAAELFTTVGVEACTLNAIAEKAGVTRGAFYWHFKNKEDILKALWVAYTKPALEAYQANILASPPEMKLQELRQSLCNIFSRIENETELGQVFCIILGNSELAIRNPKVKDFFNAERRTFFETIEHVFQEQKRLGHLPKEINTHVTATGLVCLVSGIISEYFTGFEEIKLSDHGAVFLDTYFRGMGHKNR